jgi:glucose/arabinose dehydrogenase
MNPSKAERQFHERKCFLYFYPRPKSFIMNRIIASIAALALYCSAFCQAPTPLQVETQSFLTGLSKPVGIHHMGDDRLFIVEQHTAEIEIYNTSGTFVGQFLDLGGTVATGNEQGLLGLAFHPQYTINGKLYIHRNNTSGTSEIIEYTVLGDPLTSNVADAGSGVIILSMSQPFSNHNGGCIAFGPDGYLYIGMGDGGSGGDPLNSGQTGTSLLGKMLRIGVTGNGAYFVPLDNPFVGDAGVLDEIWAQGLRNPWRFSFDKSTGDLWIGDVGQNAWEEIDFQPASSTGGENWGWRCYEGFHTYNTGGCSGAGSYDDPVQEYSHGSPYNFCSITGGVVYRGTEFPAMQGHYIFTDYCAGQLYSLKDDGAGGFDQLTVNSTGNFGYVSFGEDANGEIYVADLSGQVYRLVDPCDDVTPTISVAGGDLVCTAGPSYYWYLDGNILAGANASSYTPTVAGQYSCVVDNGAGCAVESNILDYAFLGGVLGCTYSDATNYDSAASLDDGTCLFDFINDCPADLDDNGIVNTADLLFMLGAFGEICP